jgi:hypothetical protein
MTTTFFPRFARSAFRLGFILAAAATSTATHGQVPDATAADAAWFAGTWDVVPVEVPGYETIVAAKPIRVTIEHHGDARIDRSSPLRNGQTATVEFIVKHFGKNFPWWTVDGQGSLVARIVDDQTFDLAGLGPMGKADWDHASRHKRVAAPAP